MCQGPAGCWQMGQGSGRLIQGQHGSSESTAGFLAKKLTDWLIESQSFDHFNQETTRTQHRVWHYMFLIGYSKHIFIALYLRAIETLLWFCNHWIIFLNSASKIYHLSPYGRVYHTFHPKLHWRNPLIFLHPSIGPRNIYKTWVVERITKPSSSPK